MNIALCNGVRGLKFLPEILDFVVNRIALCNGVRGLKLPLKCVEAYATRSHSVMECVD